jgi:hypothetical protein
MISALVWVVSLAIGVGAVFWGVATGQPWPALGLTALACLMFTGIAAWQRGRLVARGSGRAALAGTDAQSMALVWAWACVTILLAYVLVLDWHEWWQYVAGAGVIAVICLLFSAMMAKDAAAGREDETILRLARYLTMGQLVGMVAAMIGLVIDNKMPRDPQNPDWAAQTIFFFGAAALAVISLNALRGTSARQS